MTDKRSDTDGRTDASTEKSVGEPTDGSTDERRTCLATGREQGLIGKYDIWLCRQSFRELAREMGFRKYE